MNGKLKYSEWIDLYLEGELEGKEIEVFEQELALNDQLRFEFQLETDLNKALSEVDVIDFRALLNEVQESYQVKKNRRALVLPLNRKYWYAAASIVLLLIIAGSVFLLNTGNYTNEKLFSMYFNTEESVSISRSGDANMVEALFKFQRGEFEAATVLFNDLLGNDPQNIALQYYCGLSNVETSNYDKAIQLFNGILLDGDNLYTEYAEWYLGLTYLVDNQSEKAIQVFEGIASNQKHYFSEDAASILDKIMKRDNNRNFLNKILFFVLPF